MLHWLRLFWRRLYTIKSERRKLAVIVLNVTNVTGVSAVWLRVTGITVNCVARLFSQFEVINQRNERRFAISSGVREKRSL